jgi:hypothetical protein
MVKLRCTIEFEYDANPEHYGTDIPEEMAKIDEDNFNGEPQDLFLVMENKDFDIKVEPI